MASLKEETVLYYSGGSITAVGFSGVICLVLGRSNAEMIEMKSLGYRAKFRPECDFQKGDQKGN